MRLRQIEQWAILTSIDLHLRTIEKKEEFWESISKTLGHVGPWIGCPVCWVAHNYTKRNAAPNIGSRRCMNCPMDRRSPLSIAGACATYSILEEDDLSETGLKDWLERLRDKVMKYNTGLFPKEETP